MFDWTAFVSGIIGAVVGGSVAIAAMVVGRKDARRRRIEADIAEISKAIDAFSRALMAHPIASLEAKVHPSVLEAASDASGMAIRLQLQLKKADMPVTNWLLAEIALMLATKPADTVLAGGRVLGCLVKWHQGVLTTDWFAKRDAEVQAAADKVMEERNLIGPALQE